jgi:glycosyltransferase involved in cell wall biosynthesis
MVSVILPAYNTSEFISESITSVLSQTYHDFELIVIDDGSDDTTSTIVNAFVVNHKTTIKYYYQDNSGRPACARNKGIMLARGEWIAFLDSDDYWIKDHLQRLINRAEMDDEVALVYGSKIWVDRNGKEWPKEFQPNYEMPEGWIFSDMFMNNLMNTSSVLVKRQKLLDVGLFNESQSLRIAEDYDLFLKISAISKVACLPELKYYYRRHDANTTLDNTKRARGLITAIDNASKLIIDGMVDEKNKLKDISIRRRIIELYEHAVLAAYYGRKFKEMRKYAVEAVFRGIVTLGIIEKIILSLLPNNLVAKIRTMVKG